MNLKKGANQNFQNASHATTITQNQTFSSHTKSYEEKNYTLSEKTQQSNPCALNSTLTSSSFLLRHSLVSSEETGQTEYGFDQSVHSNLSLISNGNVDGVNQNSKSSNLNSILQNSVLQG